jgi:acyl-coenzyme A thioesterase PaaI-like protein
MVDGDEVVLDWMAAPHHAAIHGVLNGGVIATLFDCHLAWAAAWALYERNGGDTPPLAVTAELTTSYLAPTRSDLPLQIRARMAEVGERKAIVEADLISDRTTTARCRGIFVVVGDLPGAATVPPNG